MRIRQTTQVREMAKHVERPMVFPLSNPTHVAELTPEQARARSRPTHAQHNPHSSFAPGQGTLSPTGAAEPPTTQDALRTTRQAYEWTDGKAIVATGSPFDPVDLGGGDVRIPSQCNNMYIFPGLGLGASVCGAETIPDSMLYHAAVALSKMTSDAEMRSGRVFPSVTAIRECSEQVLIPLPSPCSERVPLCS